MLHALLLKVRGSHTHTHICKQKWTTTKIIMHGAKQNKNHTGKLKNAMWELTEETMQLTVFSDVKHWIISMQNTWQKRDNLLLIGL